MNFPLGYVVPANLVGKVEASELEIEGAVRYFADKGYLNVDWDSARFFAKITAFGIDQLERAGLISSQASARNKDVRNKVLKLLYEMYSNDSQSYIMSDKLVTSSGFQPNEVIWAAKYLRDKELIELEISGAGDFMARISARGIDSVEGGEREGPRLLVREPGRRRLTAAKQKYYVQIAGRCLCCGEKDIVILDVHHIKPFAEGGSNDPANLSVLCPNCHSRADKGLIQPPSLAARIEESRKEHPKSIYG